MAQKRPIAVLILFTIFFAWHCGYERTAPDELVGTWKTSVPKYADRFFKIDTDTITFGTGGENFETYAIKKVKKKGSPEEGRILYTIHYKIEEDACTFAFYHSPVSGVIMLKNQSDIIWTKEQGGP